MTQARAAPHVIKFGVFEADLASGIVRKERLRVNLQEQPFKILRILLERPGELVTREELYRALWPTGTFVEVDQGLNTAVKKLRIALEDSAEKPQLIETIPRRGYCMIAGVEPVLDTKPRKEWRRRLGLLLAGMLAACVVFSAWLMATAGNAGVAAAPLTNYPGMESVPSFSPDGRRVVFQGRRQRGAVSDLYIKVIGTSGAVQLTHGGNDNACPAWSPDGHSIAFLRRIAETRSDLYLLPPSGGPERKVAELDTPRNTPCVSWHPSGRWVVVSHQTAQKDVFALFSISIDTGEQRQLTFPSEQQQVDGDPAVSPQGDVVVFARGTPRLLSADLYLLRLGSGLAPTGAPRRLTFDHRANSQPAWTPDGRRIVFCAGTPQSPELYELDFWWFGWRPRKPKLLAFAGGGVRNPTVSKNGRLAYSRSEIRANIWRLELNGRHAAGSPAEPLIASSHLDQDVAYSPEGRRIAFASDRSGAHDIWVANSDGFGATQLTRFRRSSYTAGPRWTPEGQVLFHSDSDGTPAVYTVSPEGGAPKRLGLDGIEAWSHDHRRVYFSAHDQIWRTQWPLSASGPKPVQVTRGGGQFPRLSADDRFVYFLKDDREMSGVWKVPSGGGDETEVIPSVCCQNFEVTEQGIYFIARSHGESHSTLKFLDFERGKTTTVAELPGVAAYGLSVSPDRRNVLFALYAAANSDLWTVERFG